jgi:hypothetical protein
MWHTSEDLRPRIHNIISGPLPLILNSDVAFCNAWLVHVGVYDSQETALVAIPSVAYCNVRTNVGETKPLFS